MFKTWVLGGRRGLVWMLDEKREQLSQCRSIALEVRTRFRFARRDPYRPAGDMIQVRQLHY